MTAASDHTIRASALALLRQWQEQPTADLLALCNGDTALADEVRQAEAILSQWGSPPTFMTVTNPATAPTVRVALQTDPLAHGETRPLPPVTGLPRVPGYELERLIARGGMGVVYRATQVGLNRTVALKMILPEAADAEEYARFRAEAEAVAQLAHPNIVPIYEIGETEGRPWFALEYVPGGSLDRRTRGQPQPPRQAAALVETLARTLQFCHDRGIIHRDLKPANILLGEPSASADGLHPKVADFGLVKRQDSGLTQTGAILGTPSFMAPEQAAGKVKEIGPACDQYALGAILYQLLTGRPPFLGSTAIETVDLVLRGDPVPPRKLQPAIPQDLETICLKALAKPIANRYPACRDLADDLNRYLNNLPITARPAGWLERTRRWCQRHPAIAGLLSIIAVLVLLSIVVPSYLLYRVTEERDQKEQALQQVTTAQTALRREQEQTVNVLWKVVFEMNRALLEKPDLYAARMKILELGLGLATRIDPNGLQMEGVHHSQVGAHNDLGDMLRELGKTDEARKQYEQALVHAQRLRAEKPSDEHYEEETFVSGVKVFDMRLAQGEAKAAVEHYRQTMERFKNDDGKSKKRLHQKCHILNRLAAAALEAQDWPTAQSATTDLLATARAGDFPPMAILAYRHLGDAALKQAQPAEAVAPLDQGIEDGRKLFAQKPDRESRRLLAELLSRRGEAAFALKDLAAAEEMQKLALATLLRDGKLEGTDLVRDRLAATLYEQQAELALARGDTSAALVLLKQAEPIRRNLAEDKTHEQKQRELRHHLELQSKLSGGRQPPE